MLVSALEEQQLNIYQEDFKQVCTTRFVCVAVCLLYGESDNSILSEMCCLPSEIMCSVEYENRYMIIFRCSCSQICCEYFTNYFFKKIVTRLYSAFDDP